MFKKAVIVLFLLIFPFGQTAFARPLIIAYVDFPPYEYSENGRPAGILVTIVKQVFEQAAIPYKLQFLPFKRAYSEVKVGKIDGLFNFYKIPERKPYFDYSKPILQNPLVFFVRKETHIKYDTLADLKGLSVGAMLGYTYGSEFDKTTHFNIDRASSHQGNFSKLLFGRIDAYPCDKLVGIYVARKNNMMSEFVILPKPLKVMDGHIGFTKGKHSAAIEKINMEIVKMQENNTINTIINSFIEKVH